ncbi:MAG: guanylate kinase [Chromatiales bacterium]|nr:guanylate kinase [Chromatiales bacterium]
MTTVTEPATHRRRGRLFVISAPSGAGKTSLVRALLESTPSTRFSTSFTTRSPRSGEAEGRDYYFVNEAQFAQMIYSGAFLEHATVFDHRYGTGRAEVSRLTESGFDVLLEIDWQGARQVRTADPDCVSIFVLPPSLEELEKRLRGRSTDDEPTILRRLGDARSDMTHWDEFDYAVINDDFETALAELKSIVEGGCSECRTDDPACRRQIERVVA